MDLPKRDAMPCTHEHHVAARLLIILGELFEWRIFTLPHFPTFWLSNNYALQLYNFMTFQQIFWLDVRESLYESFSLFIFPTETRESWSDLWEATPHQLEDVVLLWNLLHTKNYVSSAGHSNLSSFAPWNTSILLEQASNQQSSTPSTITPSVLKHLNQYSFRKHRLSAWNKQNPMNISRVTSWFQLPTLFLLFSSSNLTVSFFWIKTVKKIADSQISNQLKTNKIHLIVQKVWADKVA